jgi:protein SCO1/2
VRSVAALVALVFLLACGAEKPKPLSEPGEKVYPMRGMIVARSAADNSLRVDHEAIAGFMEAMTMDYPVRGAKIETLPPDRSRIEARLHVTDRAYWITDVKRMP